MERASDRSPSGSRSAIVESHPVEDQRDPLLDPRLARRRLLGAREIEVVLALAARRQPLEGLAQRRVPVQLVLELGRIDEFRALPEDDLQAGLLDIDRLLDEALDRLLELGDL